MKISAPELIVACLAVLTVPSTGHAAPHYYHPQNDYAEDNNREGIAVSVDIDSGSTTQTYNAPLSRAGLPIKMSLTADEAEEECDYKIVFRGKRYRFIRGSATWSMRLDRNLELFLFDAGMEYASSANYLDKRFRFSVITMQNGAATERQCAIVPGDKLGLRKAGNATPDSIKVVVEYIVQRIGSGQLSAKDYNCTPAQAVPAMDTSRFDGRRQRSLAP
ncbi:hypothetical protein OOT33_02680 [Sphingobium sp. DEHP117]|uniref:hypothetical protein n=1 Tax=Sphingobium sp. DEHP117 TaxID=2993436 RepID=UPI0027D56A6D|nr:hypothetical protein [Sphingobium sp. DEHP117]MDQ4419342.1 hypothetical protein [Sphingobium sp. DEHP117]